MTGGIYRFIRYFHLPPPPSTNTSSPSCKKYSRKFFNFIKPVTNFLQLCQKSGNKNENDELLYCATQLHEAGVKFEVSQSACWLDVKFSNGKLVMPCFKLYAKTELLIRNLVALEQYQYPEDAKICDYIFLIDYLINTAKDVELLFQKKVIVNWISDTQRAADIFNSIGRELIQYKENIYIDIFRQLNEYYEMPYHNWKATQRHVFFSTPFRRVIHNMQLIKISGEDFERICLLPFFWYVPQPENAIQQFNKLKLPNSTASSIIIFNSEIVRKVRDLRVIM